MRQELLFPHRLKAKTNTEPPEVTWALQASAVTGVTSSVRAQTPDVGASLCCFFFQNTSGKVFLCPKSFFSLAEIYAVVSSSDNPRGMWRPMIATQSPARSFSSLGIFLEARVEVKAGVFYLAWNSHKWAASHEDFNFQFGVSFESWPVHQLISTIGTFWGFWAFKTLLEN